MKFYTIGHSTLTEEDFILILKKYKIEILVDIRSFPGSNYVPQFNKENLEKILPENKIEYIHLKELGGRRKSSENTDISLVEGWKNSAFRNYAAYSLTKEYEKGIDKLINLAKNKTLCYMCSEAVPWRCHRLIVSNTLVSKGFDIYHILGDKELIQHKLGIYGAKPAIVNGQIVYLK